MVYEITLTQKTKRIIIAESASNALQAAMVDVKTENKPFTPTSWSVKEKEITDSEMAEAAGNEASEIVRSAVQESVEASSEAEF